MDDKALIVHLLAMIAANKMFSASFAQRVSLPMFRIEIILLDIEYTERAALTIRDAQIAIPLMWLSYFSRPVNGKAQPTLFYYLIYTNFAVYTPSHDVTENIGAQEDDLLPPIFNIRRTTPCLSGAHSFRKHTAKKTDGYCSFPRNTSATECHAGQAI